MDAPRPASPSEMATLASAAQTYMGQALGMNRSVYGTAFDGWPADAQHACAITTAVQVILTPEAFAESTLNLDAAAHALGLALGTQTAGLPEPQMHQILARFGEAFASGRMQAITARMGVKTEGNA